MNTLNPPNIIFSLTYLKGVQFSLSVMSESLWSHGPQTTDFLVHHQLQELTLTYVYPVSDAIQLSHPLLSPSPPAFNLSQHQGLLQWVSSLHRVTKVLELQCQHLSLQWIFRTHFLWLTGLISLQSKRLSKAFSNTTVQKHQSFGTQLSLWSRSHIHI